MIAAVALLLAALPAGTGPEPICVRMADPPRGMAAWTKPIEAGAVLRPGVAVRLPMADVAGLRFAALPARAPVGGTYGAVLPLAITRGGLYRVALSETAWLDVARGAARVRSAGHMRGPPCSGIRTIITFRLAPGRYTLQVIGAPRPEGTLLVAPA